MKIKMTLLSDTIFGNGMSIPGGEDISVLHDEYGFPYFKGSTFKGIFREEFERYLKCFIAKNDNEVKKAVNTLFGAAGNDELIDAQMVFSDFELSDKVRILIRKELKDDKDQVLESLTHLRVFTAMDPDNTGIVKEGSLRIARCVNKGLTFYSEVTCPQQYQEEIKEALMLVKWIGTMRNRGFGKVIMEIVE